MRGRRDARGWVREVLGYSGLGTGDWAGLGWVLGCWGAHCPRAAADGCSGPPHAREMPVIVLRGHVPARCRERLFWGGAWRPFVASRGGVGRGGCLRCCVLARCPEWLFLGVPCLRGAPNGCSEGPRAREMPRMVVLGWWLATFCGNSRWCRPWWVSVLLRSREMPRTVFLGWCVATFCGISRQGRPRYVPHFTSRRAVQRRAASLRSGHSLSVTTSVLFPLCAVVLHNWMRGAATRMAVGLRCRDEDRAASPAALRGGPIPHV